MKALAIVLLVAAAVIVLPNIMRPVPSQPLIAVAVILLLAGALILADGGETRSSSPYPSEER